jgi:hypothetical protein
MRRSANAFSFVSLRRSLLIRLTALAVLAGLLSATPGVMSASHAAPPPTQNLPSITSATLSESKWSFTGPEDFNETDLPPGSDNFAVGIFFSDGVTNWFQPKPMELGEILIQDPVHVTLPGQSWDDNVPLGYGTYSVGIVNALGTRVSTTPFTFTYYPAPTVTSISPTNGSHAGGTVLTIIGTGFYAGVNVKIGGYSLTGVTFNSSTSITATTFAMTEALLGGPLRVINLGVEVGTHSQVVWAEQTFTFAFAADLAAAAPVISLITNGEWAAARSAWTLLTGDQKGLVTNYEVLLAAEDAAAYAAAYAAVISLITNGEWADARYYYDEGLNDVQQALVTNYDALLAAEAAALAVSLLITNLNWAGARAAYDALSADKQALVDIFLLDQYEATAPPVSADDPANTIIGLDAATMEYSINAGGTWSSTLPDLIDVVVVEVRYKAGGIHPGSPASEATTLNFYLEYFSGDITISFPTSAPTPGIAFTPTVTHDLSPEPTLTYAWFVSPGGDVDFEYAVVEGEYRQTYTPDLEHLGQYLSFQVFANAVGYEEYSLYESIQVPLVSLEIPTSAPTVGSPFTVTTVNPLSPEAELSYQWYTFSDGPSSPATGFGKNTDSYTPVIEDVGKYLWVEVSGSAVGYGYYLAESSGSAAVLAEPGAAPSITGASPDTGGTNGGTAITITGTGFVDGATVTVGGIDATGVAFVSASSITATTGAHAAGLVNIVITNPDSQVGTGTGLFTYTAAPTGGGGGYVAPVISSASSTAPVTQTITAASGGTLTAQIPGVGGASATTVTVVVPAAATTENVTLSLLLASNGADATPGYTAIKLTAVTTTGATAVTTFAQPLAITLAAGAAGSVSAWSIDGFSWLSLPLLPSAVLPVGEAEGYFINADGTFTLYTHHLTFFGFRRAQDAYTSSSSATSIQVAKSAQLTSTGGSGSGAVNYSTSTPLVCSISASGIVMGLAAGTCTLNSHKHASGIFLDARSASLNMTVSALKNLVAKNIGATKVQFTIALGMGYANKSVSLVGTAGKKLATIKLNESGSGSKTIAVNKSKVSKVDLKSGNKKLGSVKVQ